MLPKMFKRHRGPYTYKVSYYFCGVLYTKTLDSSHYNLYRELNKRNVINNLTVLTKKPVN